MVVECSIARSHPSVTTHVDWLLVGWHEHVHAGPPLVRHAHGRQTVGPPAEAAPYLEVEQACVSCNDGDKVPI